MEKGKYALFLKRKKMEKGNMIGTYGEFLQEGRDFGANGVVVGLLLLARSSSESRIDFCSISVLRIALYCPNVRSIPGIPINMRGYETGWGRRSRHVGGWGDVYTEVKAAEGEEEAFGDEGELLLLAPPPPPLLSFSTCCLTSSEVAASLVSDELSNREDSSRNEGSIDSCYNETISVIFLSHLPKK